MMPQDSEDRKLLNTIHLQMTALISKLDEREKSDEEFKKRIEADHCKLEEKLNRSNEGLSKRIKELELTGATNEVMMGNLNQVKSSLIKWIMVMFTSAIAAGFAVIKFVI